MRDPMSWSLKLFRLFDINVRLHIFYIIITIGLVLRVAAEVPEAWVDYLILFGVFLFFAVLFHEFGHCFAARHVDGEANEVLIWPLGGLAYCEVPPTPRANFITAAGGPAVTFGLAFVCAAILAAASYLPSVNPFNGPYRIELHNWRTGTNDIASEDARWVKEGTNERIEGQVLHFEDQHYVLKKSRDKNEMIPVEEAKAGMGTMPTWVLWVARFYWLNWFLFLFNLIPGFPLDGGRMLQAWIWSRTEDYRRGTTFAIYAGYISALLFGLVAIMFGEVLLLCLALFIYVTCRQQQMALEAGLEDMPFGYDFSQGYTSLERGQEGDEQKPRKQRRPGPIKRWMLRRAARRLQREREQREMEEARMDALLDKISREGEGSLTEEERRFLTRVSKRYRNRTQEPGQDEW